MSNLFTATTAAHVEEALARGEDIEEENDNTTPLVSACKRGELEVVDSLLNHGADPTHRPRASKGPIQVAAQEGNADIVERLIKAGVGINDNQNGGSAALAIASEEGHVDVVDFLLSLGIDLEVRDGIGETALMRATRGGNFDVVDRLLAAGADVNSLDNEGNQVLILAAQEGHLSIVDRLVVHGADINHISGWNALMCACHWGDFFETVDRLLSLGCGVNTQGSRGTTALMLACRMKRIKIVRLLLDHGADPLLRNEDGKRVIDLAAGSPEIQTLLNGLILLSFHHRHHHHHHHVP